MKHDAVLMFKRNKTKNSSIKKKKKKMHCVKTIFVQINRKKRKSRIKMIVLLICSGTYLHCQMAAAILIARHCNFILSTLT